MDQTRDLLKEFKIQTTAPPIFECDLCRDTHLIDATDDDIDKGVLVLIDYKEVLVEGVYVPQKRYLKKCQCQIDKDFESRMGSSDISDWKNLTFDTFITKYTWQKIYRQKAINFFKNPKRAFVMSDESGTGKTKLCLTLLKYLTYEGHRSKYLIWEKEVLLMKNNYYKVDKDKYRLWVEMPVLYIDDFLKCPNNKHELLSSHEISMARTLINERSINPNLITIISTELTDVQLNSIDESLFSRIGEMATKDYLIIGERKGNKNIRKEMLRGEWSNE